MKTQSTDAIIMVRPSSFLPNEETAKDNTFQTSASGMPLAKKKNLSAMAFEEVSNMVSVLEGVGISVYLFEDDGTRMTPDSVFPNNWLSTEPTGEVILYPMFAENRRKERRDDIVNFLIKKIGFSRIHDYSHHEKEGLYLEGTGVLILDRVNMVVYMANSGRSNKILLEKFVTDFKYKPVVFDAFDRNNNPIYHTNVMMGLGTGYSLIGLSTIKDQSQRQTVIASLSDSDHEIIDLNIEQIELFAGNVIELNAKDGKILVLSQTAYDALRDDQINQIQKYAQLLPIFIPTIEMAGGSARCMIAEVFKPQPLII